MNKIINFQVFGKVVRFSIRDRIEKQPLTEIIANAKSSGKLIILPGEELSVEDYLQDLIGQLEDDIYPLFRQTKGGAPFTVLRNTLCFVDHLSQLLYGTKGPQNTKMAKVLSELGKVDSYLNSNYKLYSPYLIQLYRHDLVHNIRPFPKSLIIKDDQSTRRGDSWFINATMCDGKPFSENLTKMKTIDSRKDRNHLRYTGNQIYIDTFSLFFDVVIFIENLKIETQNNQSLELKIVKNYYKIVEKGYSSLANFELDLSNNKEVKWS